MMAVRRSTHNRRRFVLPRKLLDEYQAYVATNPEPPSGMTYLEAFMRKKGLLSRDRQATLLEVQGGEPFGGCAR